MPALQWNILTSYYNLLNLTFYKLYIINLINLKFMEEKKIAPPIKKHSLYLITHFNHQKPDNEPASASKERTYEKFE